MKETLTIYGVLIVIFILGVLTGWKYPIGP